MDRQVLLIGKLLPQKLEHGPHPAAGDEDAEGLTVIHGSKCEREFAARLLDRRVEATAAAPELPETMVGNAEPEALLELLADREHPPLAKECLGIAQLAA